MAGHALNSAHLRSYVSPANFALAENMPTVHELSSLVLGKHVLYIGGWRHDGVHWQIFDYHMVSPLKHYP
jgi:hypothetical protein